MVELIATLRDAVSRRYAVERELGRGGNAIVFLAVDRKHARRVAIKVLSPELAAILGPERFLREIAIAAQLTHPHILPLHDSGQAAGLLYYVMPYVEGESLRERLRRDAPLPISEAVRIADEVADALAYAHRQGVVHRDVKPDNILLSEGHALLADFGVARALRLAGGERLTDSGLAVGTAAYMSPEQAAGTSAVDAQADIYSLGCVLYEALAIGGGAAGRPVEELLANRFSEPLPAVGRLRPGVPPAVEAAIARAMATSPGNRFRTAEEFRAGLARGPAATRAPWRPPRRMALALGAALVLGGAAALAVARHSPQPDPKRVLVALFENETGDPGLDPLGDIATDYVARGLAATRLVHEVVDGRLEPRGISAGELARRFGAGTVVRGSYYRDGSDLHVEAEILNPATGGIRIPLEPAVGPMDQRSQVVELLRQRVMAGFAVAFGSEFRGWAAYSVPPTYEAYLELLAGHDAMWRFDNGRAAEHFRRASELDPTYLGAKTALALAAAGDCATPDSIARAVAPAAERLQPAELGELKWAQASCRGDVAGALEAGRAVLAASPHSAGFAVLVAAAAWDAGRPAEALAVLQRVDPVRDGLEGQPLAVYWDFFATAHHLVADYRGELAAARNGLRTAPDYGFLLIHQAVALGVLGRTDEMERAIDGWQFRMGLPPVDATPGGLMLSVALELRAHGRAEGAAALLERTLAWYHQHPSENPARVSMPCLDRSFSAAYYVGRWDEARATYEQVVRDDTGSVLAHAALGAIAARRGDQADVERIDAWLAAHEHVRPREGDPLDPTYARARLAAISGDRSRAVALLARGIREGRVGQLCFHADADLESLRDYRPFQDLIRPKD